METVTVAKTVALLSERTGLSEKQVKAVLQAQAELAYQHAHGGYPIAGIGMIKVWERKAHTFTMTFGPKQGQTVMVPAKNMVKLYFSRTALAHILAHDNSPIDIDAMQAEPFEEGDPGGCDTET